MGTIHWIATDGTVTTEEADKAPNRKWMQRFVGGNIEHVSVLYKGHFPTHMYVNETGRLDNLPINPTATEIYYAASRYRGVEPTDPEAVRRDTERFAAELGAPPEAIITVDPQPDLPPAIHGPAVLLEGIEQD